jgi:uncharacterized protein YabE (DUF348 family)
MSMRAINHVVRNSACVIMASALLAGVGVGAANAATSSSEPTTVQLKVGSRDADQIATEAARPQALLEEAGVEVDGNDVVDVIRDGHLVQSHQHRVLRDGDKVKVVRVWHKAHVRTVRVDPKTAIRKVTSLKPGHRRVVRDGYDGIRKVHVRTEVRNGRVVDRDVHKHWERRPQPRVVLVGTRLDWDALAQCESGGNPHAVNSAGYYGLYQFSVGTWRGVGGSGMPNQASPAEQTYRAQKLYAERGRSPWPYCGRFL